MKYLNITKTCSQKVNGTIQRIKRAIKSSAFLSHFFQFKQFYPSRILTDIRVEIKQPSWKELHFYCHVIGLFFIFFKIFTDFILRVELCEVLWLV